MNNCENSIKIRKRLNAGTVPNKEYAAGTLPANKEYAAGTLSNVLRCCLAMPLVAGVPYNREKKRKSKKKIFFSGTFLT